jgi:hypothetical protein
MTRPPPPPPPRRSEVVGRNCRFLQGPGTDPAEVQRLRGAVTADPPQPVTVTLLNYKRGGEPFWNALHVAPIRDAQVGAGRLGWGVGGRRQAAGGRWQEAAASRIWGHEPMRAGPRSKRHPPSAAPHRCSPTAALSPAAAPAPPLPHTHTCTCIPTTRTNTRARTPSTAAPPPGSPPPPPAGPGRVLRGRAAGRLARLGRLAVGRGGGCSCGRPGQRWPPGPGAAHGTQGRHGRRQGGGARRSCCCPAARRRALPVLRPQRCPVSRSAPP